MNKNIRIPVWEPSAQFVEQSELYKYKAWIEQKEGQTFSDYEELWAWSTKNPEEFWKSLIEYFEPVYSGNYDKVLSSAKMPGAKWFEGLQINYAENIFAKSSVSRPAIIWKTEVSGVKEISWSELENNVLGFQNFLKSKGIGKGDRLVAYISNIPEASTAFLASCSLGTIWSSCSPDFGVDSVVDRFKQIQPKVLIAVEGYYYGGKYYSRLDHIRKIAEQIDSLETVIIIPSQNPDLTSYEDSWVNWNNCITESKGVLHFERVPFDHPIWVLYSSGTTGRPKAITHGHGGVLLEHLKYLHFHNDVKPGERFFWFSTTGWMMWNFVHASFLAGATVVLYDGSPGYPDLGMLWKFCEKARIHHFGTSAPFVVACMKQGLQPGKEYNLKSLRSIGSTGSPLPPEAFDWVYKEVKGDIWLCSMSGGTDVCTAFVGGCPMKPVYLGEIQCRTLGCDLHALSDNGTHVIDELGEMVIEFPMPSMPVYFWNDPDGDRYKSSYFDVFPGKWRHGDYININQEGGLIIYGRSDATLNRQGVRIGTSEIYRAMNTIESVKDSLIVNLELSGGRHFMPLFVLLEKNSVLTDELKSEIKKCLRSTYSPRHVPDEIIQVSDIPYTISGKKMEAPVKKILMGMSNDQTLNKDAMRNPGSMDFFFQFAETIERED